MVITITDEQKKLVEDNHNLIYSFLSKHNLSVDDYYDLAAIGLCTAAITYNSKKSNFSTYAYQCIKTSIIGETRKLNFQRTIPNDKIVYYQSTFNSDGEDELQYIDSLPSQDDVEDSVIESDFMDKFSEKDKTIIKLIMAGYSQREIGKMLGCTGSNIGGIRKRIKENFVKEYTETQ